MKKLHIVIPYQSIAMQRMTVPLVSQLANVYEVTEGAETEPDADINLYIPWRGILSGKGNHYNVVAYTHCNPPDVPLIQMACRDADLVTAMSFTGRRELIEMGVHPEKISVVYCGGDHFQFRKRNIGVVAYGQPNGRKRQHLLIDLAWRMDTTPYHFMIAGTGWGETVETLKGMGVSAEYHEHLPDENLQEFYAHLDLMLVTAYAEGGPLPVLESMSAGVPMLAPHVGYAEDLLDPDELYDSDIDLAEKIDKLFAPIYRRHELITMLPWQNYVTDYGLVLGRMCSENVDIYPHLGMSRYSQLLDVIDEKHPQSICEIGTWTGERAIQMLQQAAKYRPMESLVYIGYDLFDSMTPEHMTRELSKRAWPVVAVRKRIAATGANVVLIPGDTHNTLDTSFDQGRADMYYIDGGHSEETIAHDWTRVVAKMYGDSVIVLDDYYYPPRDGFGCNKLIDSLDRNIWNIEILPVKTPMKGGGEVGMVKVTLNGDLYLRRQEQTRAAIEPLYAGVSGYSVSDLRLNDVEKAAGVPGELGRAIAASGSDARRKRAKFN